MWCYSLVRGGIFFLFELFLHLKNCDLDFIKTSQSLDFLWFLNDVTTSSDVVVVLN